MMWHTFGRAIDTCFARKQQISVVASGELFLRIAQLKISVVQGVSIFKSPEGWQQFMLNAFGVLFVCYDEPSEYLFPLVSRYAVSDLPESQTYTQEEVVIYWESLQMSTDNEHKPAEKRQRKRPNVASYITEVIRETLKEMPPTMQQAITSNMTSLSLRRGAAAYANSCPKLEIQWISTRGAWLLKSITKAFTYIDTINQPPSTCNGSEYQAWKHRLWDLAQPLERTVNERLHALDGKKSTTKVSSLRKRWRRLRSTHPAAYQALGAQYLVLKSNASITDAYTPESHQWGAGDLA